MLCSLSVLTILAYGSFVWLFAGYNIKLDGYFLAHMKCALPPYCLPACAGVLKLLLICFASGTAYDNTKAEDLLCCAGSTWVSSFHADCNSAANQHSVCLEPFPHASFSNCLDTTLVAPRMRFVKEEALESLKGPMSKSREHCRWFCCCPGSSTCFC